MSRLKLADFPERASPGIDWDDADCPLCRRHEEEARFEAADANPAPDRPALTFLAVRCQHCGTTYTNPRPGPLTLGEFYSNDYKPHRSKPKRKTGGRGAERRGELPWEGMGRLLDFGCGNGSYLQRMADRGWEVTGLDTSEDSVEGIETHLGLRAFAGTLPHPELQPGSFEIVTLWHSLEHVPEPLETLREIYELLVPGGKVVVAVPNLAGYGFRTFGKNWFGLDMPRHLTHFTPTTLQMMLQSAGFRIESIKQIRHPSWLRSSAKLAGGGWLASKPFARLASLFAHATGKSDCIQVVASRG